MLKCSPLKGAALVLLLNGPIHGYEMATSMNQMLGPGWDIRAQALYPKLGSLENAGLARSSKDDNQRAAPARKVFYPTEATAGAAMDWMSATGPLAVVRAEFYTKLAVARREHLPALLETLDVLERHAKAEIDEIAEDLGPLVTLAGLRLHLVRGAKLAHLRTELERIVVARRGIREFL
jgi:DNA-binding PadR family transcriptional regulator